jgi:hypothetical protein
MTSWYSSSEQPGQIVSAAVPPQMRQLIVSSEIVIGAAVNLNARPGNWRHFFSQLGQMNLFT